MPHRLRTLIVAGVLALATPASATTRFGMDTRALAARTRDITIGELTAVRSRWTVRIVAASELVLIQSGGR